MEQTERGHWKPRGSFHFGITNKSYHQTSSSFVGPRKCFFSQHLKNSISSNRTGQGQRVSCGFTRVNRHRRGDGGPRRAKGTAPRPVHGQEVTANAHTHRSAGVQSTRTHTVRDKTHAGAALAVHGWGFGLLSPSPPCCDQRILSSPMSEVRPRDSLWPVGWTQTLIYAKACSCVAGRAFLCLERTRHGGPLVQRGRACGVDLGQPSTLDAKLL